MLLAVPPQALLFIEAGSTPVPPKPWDRGTPATVARDLGSLPPEAQRFVQMFLEQQAQQEAGVEAGSGGSITCASAEAGLFAPQPGGCAAAAEGLFYAA